MLTDERQRIDARSPTAAMYLGAMTVRSGPALCWRGYVSPRRILLHSLAHLLVALPALAQSAQPNKPPPETQHSKSTKERGGVDPCNTRDPGFGAYRRWSRSPSLGQMLVPKKLPSNREVDVMLHFHGHEAARKAWIDAIHGPILVGIDLGIGSAAYTKPFEDPTTFERLLASIRAGVERETGAKVRIRKLGLSAWSAGYGAVGAILRRPESRALVDTVVLLDGLHTAYVEQGAMDERPLSPFLDFARDAAEGRGFFFFSHSSIDPVTYASTTETAGWLVTKLGGRFLPSKARPTDPVGLELIRWYSSGSAHFRGYSGNDKPDHCAHLTLYRDILRHHVVRRWR